MDFLSNKTLKDAKHAAKTGQTDLARRLFQNVLKQHPGNFRVLAGLEALDEAGDGLAKPGGVSQRDHLAILTRHYKAGAYKSVIDYGLQWADALVNNVQAQNLLGASQAKTGDLQAAIQNFKRAVELEPNNPFGHSNLGTAFANQGRLEDAISHLISAKTLKPDYAAAHNNLGNALNSLGRYEAAIQSYENALEADPRYAGAHNNLGNLYSKRGQRDKAIASFEAALKINPGLTGAHFNLGGILRSQGDLQGAVACYDNALHLDPAYSEARAHKLHLLAHMCDWDALRPELQEIDDLGINGRAIPPFTMLSFEDDPARHKKRAEVFANNPATRADDYVFPLLEVRPKRLRVGYFTANAHKHAVWYLIAKMIELHDKDQFEVIVFSYGRIVDDMTERTRETVDTFVDARSLSDDALIELARSQKIDVAVDLMGYTQDSRSWIFAKRVAPVQVSYLGYPGTLGMRNMDYILADKVVIPPDSQAFFSEKVYYLPDVYQVNDCTLEISDQPVSRSECNLPDNGFVFCCFNSVYKISPAEFDIWMRLLSQIDGSVLWLLKCNSWAEENLKRAAVQRGISPDRLVFAPRAAPAWHRARHRCADLFLDTFNVNAHSTASDALWAGLPIVTKLGNSFAARVAGSLLTSVGLPELVTKSETAYEALALELARSPQRLDTIKNHLTTNITVAPLFDTMRFTRAIEKAYLDIYSTHLASGRPDA